MAVPDADFQKAVDRVAQHLTSEDSKAVAASTVTLTLMLQSTPLTADLSAVVQRAAELLEAADVALQVGGVKRTVAVALPMLHFSCSGMRLPKTDLLTLPPPCFAAAQCSGPGLGLPREQ